MLLLFIGCGNNSASSNKELNISVTNKISNRLEISLKQKIVGLYVAYFNRASDWEGLQYWSNRGDDEESRLQELSAGFAEHEVFITTYSKLDNHTFVEAIYRNVLGNMGDKEGINYWTEYLNSGRSRSDMVSDFVEISLSGELTAENFPTLTTPELSIAQERQDLITNKVTVALYFTTVFKEKSNIEDIYNPKSDPAYKASIKIIENITKDFRTVSEAKRYIDTLITKDNPISIINGTQNKDTTTYTPNYPTDEHTIQKALDNGSYNYVINQLTYNRGAYSDMSDDKVNMNIAGAYVGRSGYTVFDITGAMASSNSNSSLNGFIFDITKDNDALSTLKSLKEADNYYSAIVNGINCSDTSELTDEQKSSCFNLGLVRLTSLSNSVKLLFGGESQTVKKWAEGVEVNSIEDLNGNGVIDKSDASACAIIYANNSNDSCSNGSMYTYRGKVTFTKSGVEHNSALIEVDVGSSEYGYNTFYKLITNKSTDNSPLLTNGICDKNFNMTTQSADGVNYFPCPTFDSSGNLMNIKDSLALSANIQNLFSTDSETRTTTESYIKNITGSKDGIINQNNLSNYLQRH